MNKTSRTDEPYEEDIRGFNQNPAFLSADLTTNQDLNGIVNERALEQSSRGPILLDLAIQDGAQLDKDPETNSKGRAGSGQADDTTIVSLPKGGDTEQPTSSASLPVASPSPNSNGEGGDRERGSLLWGRRLKKVFIKFCSFIGPGFMIAVAYSMQHTTRPRSRLSLNTDNYPLQLILGTILLAWRLEPRTNSDCFLSCSWPICLPSSSRHFALSWALFRGSILPSVAGSFSLVG